MPASTVGKFHDLCGSVVVQRRDVEEVSIFAEELDLALLDGDVFPIDHNPVVFLAFDGSVEKFRHVFCRQADVFELAFTDNLVFDILRPVSFLGLNLVLRLAF